MRWVLVLAILGCSNSNKNATPKGTKVIDWDASKSDREAFKTASFDGKKPADQMIDVKACADAIKLQLHYETATAKYQEAGTAVEIAAFASLTATVVDGKDFTLSASKCDGPNYDLGAPGQAPSYTILDCHFKATKPNNECAPMFQIKGDGTILSN